MADTFSSIDSAVAAIGRGEIVIVLDAEDRENEGDFICAASKVTPAMVNFMLNGRGLLCVAILPEAGQRLDLTPMATTFGDSLRTAFTVSIDHSSVRTGITAEERSTTIRKMLEPACQASDFIRPGHIFPLIAKEGGVLRRAGHTEAAVDLARLAGLPPAGVLCEILGSSGERATRDELFQMAREHNLAIITIEELIRYRRQREKLVQRAAEADLPTAYGRARIIVYQVAYEEQEPVALVFGELAEHEAPLVRLHSSCFTGDLLASLRCDCGDQLGQALETISREGAGVLVYLPQEGRGIGLREKIRAYQLQDQGLDTVEANLALGYKADPRDYGVGIQVLKDLGLTNVRLLTNNPKKTDAFIYGGFDLRVVGQVPILPTVTPHNAKYLATKREKMGHQLPAPEHELTDPPRCKVPASSPPPGTPR